MGNMESLSSEPEEIPVNSFTADLDKYFVMYAAALQNLNIDPQEIAALRKTIMIEVTRQSVNVLILEKNGFQDPTPENFAAARQVMYTQLQEQLQLWGLKEESFNEALDVAGAKAIERIATSSGYRPDVF